jgi:hypothetical protein
VSDAVPALDLDRPPGHDDVRRALFRGVVFAAIAGVGAVSLARIERTYALDTRSLLGWLALGASFGAIAMLAMLVELRAARRAPSIGRDFEAAALVLAIATLGIGLGIFEGNYVFEISQRGSFANALRRLNEIWFEVRLCNAVDATVPQAVPFAMLAVGRIRGLRLVGQVALALAGAAAIGAPVHFLSYDDDHELGRTTELVLGGSVATALLLPIAATIADALERRLRRS